MSKSPEEEHPVKAFGWAARDQSGHLSPFNFSRRQLASGKGLETNANMEMESGKSTSSTKTTKKTASFINIIYLLESTCDPNLKRQEVLIATAWK
ncbi:hypothetical protein NC652_036525 [Populus alba x Populus x berolinensis]|nr:hypothetical protein NC652_036525 [Populus alba x Populus x berolinensis]